MLPVLCSAAWGQIDVTKLVWSTCGACPQAAEVQASGPAVNVGVAGRAQTDQQNQAFHMAATLLPPAASYTIKFQYSLTTWDSYDADGTPNPPFNGGTGFWDSFSVSISNQPYWHLSLTDPITTTELPGLGLLWGGTSYGGNNPPQQNSGTTTITIKGDPKGSNYLNVGLDTATEPEADTNYPSWGTFTIISITATCMGDITDIGGVPSYYQCGNPYKTPPAGQAGAWWPQVYDHEPTSQDTICKWGCAMSSLSMVLSAHGFPYNPSTLNTALNNLGANGYDTSGNVVWNAVSFLSGSALEYMPGNASDTTDVDADLCQGWPVILGVHTTSSSCPSTNSNSTCHWVVAIGKTDGAYDIIDPGHILVNSMSFYGNTITAVRRFIPPGSGAFIVYADAGVQVLVTDPTGRRVGYGNGTTYNEMPGAYFGDEQITSDDMDSPSGTLPLTHIVFIPAPGDGFYQVQITGQQNGPASVRIYRYNKQNLPLTNQTITTNLAPDQTLTQTTTYSTKPGDVNGDGYVNAADLAIVVGSFGKRFGQPGYNPAADINGDGIVDVRDLAFVAHFDPPPSPPPVIPPRR